ASIALLASSKAVCKSCGFAAYAASARCKASLAFCAWISEGSDAMKAIIAKTVMSHVLAVD
ncbi:MAG: hypothetical protein VX217_03320, partial [Acidobacteriota bacterium]|nr:hypothetical protein [Acidobacteriota bacterium]